jgi:hypothetical protein
MVTSEIEFNFLNKTRGRSHQNQIRTKKLAGIKKAIIVCLISYNALLQKISCNVFTSYGYS